jgi:Tfp pilus assembly protein PilX
VRQVALKLVAVTLLALGALGAAGMQARVTALFELELALALQPL